MNYAVTIVEKEYRVKAKAWVTADNYFWVVEAESKQDARKKALSHFQDRKQFRLGKVFPSDKDPGIHYPNYQTL